MKPVEIRFSLHRPLQHRDPAMVPTITSAMIYSKEHLTLTNKLRKPVVEKLHRDRNNNSIEQLKSLLVPEILNQQPDFKLDKADILEMTVFILRRQQQNQQVSSSSCSAPVNQGYSRCIQEIVHFLSKDELKTQSQRRLLRYYHSLQPSSDKNRIESDCPQLSSPAQPSTASAKTRVQSTSPSGGPGRDLQTGAPLRQTQGWTIVV